MPPADADSLAALAAEFIKGRRPSGPEEALSILGLLAGTILPRRPGARPTAARPGPASVEGVASSSGEEKLRLVEARYRALVEQIPAVVFLASLEGGLSDIYVNPQIEALLGFTQKEWTSNPVLWFRQLHPDDRTDISREFASACITGRPFRRVLRVFSRDGSLRWVHAEARFVRDEAGHPLFLHGVGFDVTEQQRAAHTRQELLLEQAARDEADRDRVRLRDMFVNLPAAIAILNGPDHVIEFLNPAALEMAGVGPEAMGKTWREVFPELTKETAMLDRVFSTGKAFAAQDWLMRSPRWDHDRYLNFVCQGVRDRHGKVTSVLIHTVEVTQQRRAQAAAEAASRRALLLADVSHGLAKSLDYRATLKEVAALVVPDIADLAGIDLIESDGTMTSAALRHGSAEGTPMATGLRERLLDLGVGGGIRHVTRTGTSEFVCDANDGEATEAAGRASRDLLRSLGLSSLLIVPIRGRDRVLGAMTLATVGPDRKCEPADLTMAEDMAQRIALAIDNARLYRQAEEASRLKDEFLATLSHELRTPLNAILGWAHMLRQRAAESAPDMIKGVETIVRNAQVQSQLIADILDVSRIIAGKLVLNLRPIHLSAVIDAAMETVQPAARAKDIRLEPVIDASGGPVSGDPDRLQQVVWNLLANAIKFTPRGGRVHVRLEAINSHFELTVEDNGPGVDPEFLPFIFERFRQADSSSTRRHGGLGLGLAIVRHLVELHGGTVEAGNREARAGAVFKVKFPRRSVAAEDKRHPLQRHPQAEETVWLDAAPSLATVKVLVVDDEPDARELVVAALGRCGAQATAVASAAEALRALSAERFDVLLADIEMPDQDGYDLIRTVRRLPADRGGTIPAAALTAYASAQDRVKVLGAGFQMHVPKPVQPAELAAVVASLAQAGPGRRR
jgi:PAS domain S-box-containing protein